MYNSISINANLPQVKESTEILVSTPNSITDICRDMASLAQESFQVITVNAKNKMIDRHLVSLGLVDATLVHPREVFAPVITDRACACVVVHNHPSGNPNPSAEDLQITKTLIKAGKILEINILDHIIMASNGHVSLREEGLCQFS